MKKKPIYSFKINYRSPWGGKREKLLRAASDEYQIEPSCRLIDRVLQDLNELITLRENKREAIREMEKKVIEEKKRLAAGLE